MSYNFVNPYNFIPIAKAKPERKSMEMENAELYTGVIKYSVLTKTPLFIPNTSNDNIFGITAQDKDGNPDLDENGVPKLHKSYDFFSYTDLSTQKDPEKAKTAAACPVIPGSEIRGLIRSNFEIITNSCLSAADEDINVSKRTHETFKAGLIKKTLNGYDLYEAEDSVFRAKASNCLDDDTEWNGRINKDRTRTKSYIQKDLVEGQKVQFKKVQRQTDRGMRIDKSLAFDINKDGSRDTGYIMKGEDGPDMGGIGQKHNLHIFSLPNSGSGFRKNDISISLLEIVLREYEKQGIHEYAEYTRQLEKFCSKETTVNSFFPVYYSCIKINNDDQMYLAPACFTREAYVRKVGELIGNHKACRDKKHLCPACRLFGTLTDKFTVASRVRFSDMVFSDPDDNHKTNGYVDIYDAPITLQPLSTPKINNMEFYLEKPADDAVFWTYDYYIDKKGQVHKNNMGISGRKFYWHNMDAKLPEGIVPTELNQTIRPLKSNQLFTGDVFFEKLTKEELNSLIYVLNCGEISDTTEIDKKKHGYKLGGAKPLGLGSIAINVDSVETRQIVVDTDTKTIQRCVEPYSATEETLIDENVVKDFQMMTNFASVKGACVDYPREEKGKDIFDWFTKVNHVAYSYRYVREEGRKMNVLNKSPNVRKDEKYSYYMESMEPYLKKVAFNENAKPNFVNEIIEDAADTDESVGKDTFLQKDKWYDVQVVSYKDNGKERYLEVVIKDTEITGRIFASDLNWKPRQPMKTHPYLEKKNGGKVYRWRCHDLLDNDIPRFKKQ